MNDVDEIEPLDIEHDALISQIEARNREDGERASSAGTSRNMIKDFLDETGMNSRALSWCRAIMKTKKYSAKMDIIRSMKEALPMIEAHVVGQSGSELDFDGPDGGAVEPVEDDFKSADPEIQAESDDFDKQLAEAAE